MSFVLFNVWDVCAISIITTKSAREKEKCAEFSLRMKIKKSVRHKLISARCCRNICVYVKWEEKQNLFSKTLNHAISLKAKQFAEWAHMAARRLLISELVSTFSPVHCSGYSLVFRSSIVACNKFLSNFSFTPSHTLVSYFLRNEERTNGKVGKSDSTY